MTDAVPTEAVTTANQIRAFFHRSGHAVKERLGDAAQILTEFPVSGLAFSVTVRGRAQCPEDFFFGVGEEEGRPTQGGFSAKVADGGALAISDADQRLVIVYSPHVWGELKTNTSKSQV